MLRLLPILLVALVFAAATDAAPKYRFGPFKDDLFKTKVVAANFGGAYTLVEFSQARDLDGRDAVPEKKAKPQYVAQEIDAKQQDLVLAEGSLKVPFVEVGDISKPVKSAFIFVHGRGGNRFQGVDDWT